MERIIDNARPLPGKGRRLPIENLVRRSEYESSHVLESVSLFVSPLSVALALGGIAFLLILASVGVLTADYLTGYNSVLIHKLVKLFDVDLELNVPTFFSVLLLFAASFLLAVISVLRKKQKAPSVLGWAFLSAGFLMMAFDEMASVHERLIEPMQSILGIQNLGVFYYAWVVPAMVLVVFLGIAFLRFLIDLPVKTKTAFIVAASMFLGGSIGLELFEGVYGMGNLAYVILATTEEALEMGGVIVFIWALLNFIADNYRDGELRIGLSQGTGKTTNIDHIEEFGLQS